MKAFPANRPQRVRRQIVRLQPVTKTTYEVMCGVCGGWFAAHRSDARWCSGKCRSKAWRMRQKDRKYLAELVKREHLFDSPLDAYDDPTYQIAQLRYHAETDLP